MAFARVLQHGCARPKAPVLEGEQVDAPDHDVAAKVRRRDAVPSQIAGDGRRMLGPGAQALTADRIGEILGSRHCAACSRLAGYLAEGDW